MRSQVSLRKHHYEQSWWRWWNSSWAISNPKRWCCESATPNMPANLENSAVATGLEKVSFHSNPKKGNAKECSNYHTIALISHASKVMLKNSPSQAGFSNTWTVNNTVTLCLTFKRTTVFHNSKTLFIPTSNVWRFKCLHSFIVCVC